MKKTWKIAGALFIALASMLFASNDGVRVIKNITSTGDWSRTFLDTYALRVQSVTYEVTTGAEAGKTKTKTYGGGISLTDISLSAELATENSVSASQIKLNSVVRVAQLTSHIIDPATPLPSPADPLPTGSGFYYKDKKAFAWDINEMAGGGCTFIDFIPAGSARPKDVLEEGYPLKTPYVPNDGSAPTDSKLGYMEKVHSEYTWIVDYKVSCPCE